jgi:hypothetical protein
MFDAQRARSSIPLTALGKTAQPSVDAIVVLPYTHVVRSSGARTYRMSHFTARCILGGLELYRQGVAARFILPSEQRAPATSDLEQAYLLRRGVGNDCIVNLPDLNGTLEQLEAVARLQQRGELGTVVVLCFAFHADRVRTYMRLLGIEGELAAVEHIHAEFLRTYAGAVRISEEELLNLPQLAHVLAAERGITGTLLRLDRPFGNRAPVTRLFKWLAGPTITDIERGQARVGLVRLEIVRRLLRTFTPQLLRPKLGYDPTR